MLAAVSFFGSNVKTWKSLEVRPHSVTEPYNPGFFLNVSKEVTCARGKSELAGTSSIIPATFVITELSNFKNLPNADLQSPKYFSALFLLRTVILGSLNKEGDPSSHLNRKTLKN